MPNYETELHLPSPKAGRSFAMSPEQIKSSLAAVFQGDQIAHRNSLPSQTIVALKQLYNRANPNSMVEVNDRYDAAFAEKIKEFQRSHSINLGTKDDETIKVVTVVRPPQPNPTTERGLYADGIVGPRTVAALAALAGEEFRSELKTTGEFKKITGGRWDMSQLSVGTDVATVRDLPSLSYLIDRYKITPEEQKKLQEITARIGADDPRIPLLTFIAESDFKPGAKNPNSSASGIFQLMASNAEKLGTTAAAVRQMSRSDQMDLYVRYKEMVVGDKPIRTLSDAYALLLAPASVGKGKDVAMYSRGSAGYSANRALDRNRDGAISVGEGQEFVLSDFRKGL